MLNPNLLDITTERLVLRLPTHDDIPSIIHYFQDNRVHFQEVSPRFPPDFFTETYWQRTLPLILQEALTDLSLRLFIFDAHQPRRVIGNCNLTQIQRNPTHSAILGYSIDLAFQGTGRMTEALHAVIDAAFTSKNLHRLTASYLPTNTRSGQLLRRLGFSIEGYARDYILINGRWADHICASLINPHWHPT